MSTSVLSESLGSESRSIPNLVRLAREGAVRVPTFQRSFVWDAGDVRRLFDSIYRGFPIGTILLWRQYGPAGRVNIGPISVDVREHEDALWVVDGLQRITSLLGALSPDLAGVDNRFEVYFDLETKSFVNPRRGVVTARSVPIREALDSKSLINWLRRHSDDLEDDDFDLADRLGGSLRDYKIPTVVVEGDDRSVLRDVFDRVNSAGRPISRAQVFHALFAGDTEPGSPASVVAELRHLGFGTVDENRVVQSLLAIRGGNVQRELRGEFAEIEDPADWYDLTEQAMADSIRFLQVEGVPHLLLAPNTLPVPILAAYFFLHPDPKPWTRRLLSRWLWRGWVNGFGSESGQTPTLRRAITSINPALRDTSQAPDEYAAVKALLDEVPDRGAPTFRLDDFRPNRANGRLVLLALFSLRPRDEHGNLLDVPQLLETQGTGAITDLIKGHRTRAAARSFWPSTSAPINEVHDEDILRSHAIGIDSARNLAAGKAAAFLASRDEEIRSLLHNFLDSRLEPRSIIRPPLDDLVATGLAEED